jgi:hypothetical protein
MATDGIKQQAAGAVVTGTANAGATVLIAAGWVLKRTWRRMLPAYWAAGTWLSAATFAWLDLPGWCGLIAAAVAMLVAAGWRTHSGWIRCYRATVAGALGLWAVVADPLSRGWAIQTLALATLVLGWPWWRHLRDVVEPDPPEVDHTDEWVRRWQIKVIGHGVCKNTALIVAKTVRAGVTEATIRLLPGTKIGEVVKTGSAVETCLDLPEGSVGWRRTGRAAKLKLVIVERSYIHLPVPYPGPTYRDGRFQIITYADGTPGEWIHQQEGSGTLNGLIVGSSNAGKSRALGVIIDNLLHAGVMVVVCDPQNGQSLPKWRSTVGEYHDGVAAAKDLIRRLHPEVMERSSRLAAEGIDAYDPSDPKIIALGIRQLAVIIDECHLVLTMHRDDLPVVGMLEEIMAIDRKTGVSVILATQLPQMKSLGGSIRIRDAAVAGNALILRLSNRGSGTTVLPDDFIGDPFSIPMEIESGGKKLKTAGCGYSRAAERIGMLGRVPFLDEAAAAASHARRPVEWIVDQPDQQPAGGHQRPAPAASGHRESTGSAAADVANQLSAFGVHPSPPPQKPTSTKEWIRARLRISPQTANALLDRPDCPVRPAQLRAVLAELRQSGDIDQPGGSGTPWMVTS